MTQDYNPYQAPQSDLTVETDGERLTLLDEPNRLSIGSGFQWIVDAWRIFMMRPLFWVVLGLINLAFSFVLGALGAIPFIGLIFSLLSGLITMMLLAGMCYISYLVECEEEADFSDLFVAFKDRWVDFLVLFLIQLLAVIVLLVVVGLVVGFVAYFMLDGQLFALNNNPMVFSLVLLIALLFFIPVMMAAYFSPVLVLFHDLKPLEALTRSFKACLRNILPFLLYGIIIFLLMMIAIIPFGLGLLVALPLMCITIYTAYKDIFTAS